MNTEIGNWQVKTIVEKFRNNSLYAVETSEGNLLLEGGINQIWLLLVGVGIPFNNTNARIGVGDSSVVEESTQTGLVATTNIAYKPQDTNYPQVADQSIMFKATFGTSDANFQWNEWIVDNGTTALNRKVRSFGLKNSGETWSLSVMVTLK